MAHLKFLGLGVTGLLLAAATGCTTTGTAHDFAFDACRQEAMARSEQATAGRSSALYHAAAEQLSHCAESAGPGADEVVMQTQALAVINYFMAGDVDAASRTLNTFRERYRGKDLYFADGTSFIDTASLLLAEHDDRAASKGSLVNANHVLKSELRRVQFWQRN